MNRLRKLLFVLLLLGLTSALPLQAGTVTWTGATDSTWGGANWTPAAPVADDDVVVPAITVGDPPYELVIDSLVTTAQLDTMGVTGGTVTQTGGTVSMDLDFSVGGTGDAPGATYAMSGGVVTCRRFLFGTSGTSASVSISGDAQITANGAEPPYSYPAVINNSEVTISGSAQVTVNTWLRIGHNSYGGDDETVHLTIRDGAVLEVNSGLATIGEEYGTPYGNSNTVDVIDGGTFRHTDPDGGLYVNSWFATGTLNVGNGGLVDSTPPIILGCGGGTGYLNISNTLAVCSSFCW